MQVDAGVDVAGGFQRGQLAEWMELTVQNAPPTRPHARAVPGGLQDSYVRAVRHYLTEASLAVQAARHPTEAPVTSMLVGVQHIREGPEGLLLSCVVLQVLEGLAGQEVAAGSSVRLLLHTTASANLDPPGGRTC